MFLARAVFTDQTRTLQQAFRPGVTDLDAVNFAQLLVKMRDIEIEVFVPVKPENFFDHGNRNSSGTRSSDSFVKHRMKTELFVVLFNAPQMSRANAQNLGCLNPGQLFRISS